ncbi:DUF6538 domain-containing protein [Cognatishimia coralii]|uniref:DUF6538 domain-containing protein n=1 Tax=Cognatishimia coralii TaxID=3083254 RepID=UPI0034DAF8E4
MESRIVGLIAGGPLVGITQDRGRYYFVLNVPNHLFGKVLGKSGQPVRQVRQALRTADLSVAKRKAVEVEKRIRTQWHLLELGEDALAYEQYQAAKSGAESRGFDYVPSDVLLKRSFQENIPRLLAASGTLSRQTSPEVRDALLGSVNVSLPPLRKVWEEFRELTKTKRLRKSDRQKHLWALPRERAVANFEKAKRAGELGPDRPWGCSGIQVLVGKQGGSRKSQSRNRQ